MRKELLELLRELEEKEYYKNEYLDDEGSSLGEYSVEESLQFPNYRHIVEEFRKKRSTRDSLAPISSNSVKAELKRMEADELLIIDTQDGVKYIEDCNGTKFTSESIILTTKGKNKWRYLFHKITENPVSTGLSIVAIIISIIALFVS